MLNYLKPIRIIWMTGHFSALSDEVNRKKKSKGTAQFLSH